MGSCRLNHKKQVQINSTDFLYRGSSSGGPDFPGALAEHLNEYLEPHRPITTDHIRISASATAMHDTLAWALANSGEAFLTSRPVYGRLELDFFNRSGVRVEYADTSAEDCFTPGVVDKFDEALNDCNARRLKVKALFIVNPHNPLGNIPPFPTYP